MLLLSIKSPGIFLHLLFSRYTLFKLVSELFNTSWKLPYNVFFALCPNKNYGELKANYRRQLLQYSIRLQDNPRIIQLRPTFSLQRDCPLSHYKQVFHLRPAFGIIQIRPTFTYRKIAHCLIISKYVTYGLPSKNSINLIQL